VHHLGVAQRPVYRQPFAAKFLRDISLSRTPDHIRGSLAGLGAEPLDPGGVILYVSGRLTSFI
jgi:hypothetical protein